MQNRCLHLDEPDGELAKLHRELSREADDTEVEVTKFLRTTVFELRTRLQENSSTVAPMAFYQSW